MVRNINLDRKLRAKIILNRNLREIPHNVGRADVVGEDTLNRKIYKKSTKVFVGKRGGYFVIINHKKRYIKY